MPVELRYVSATGKPGRIEIGSYVLDLSKGTLALSDLKLFGEGTGSVASVRHADLTGLNVLYGADQVLTLRARGVDARLVRMESGRFEFEDFLPEQKEPSTDIPFQATVEDIRVQLIDRAGTPWRSTLTTNRIVAAGVGDDWIAAGRGTIAGVGDAEVRLQNVGGFGLSILANSNRLEVASLANHLATTRDLKDVFDVRGASARSLIVQGPFQVFLPAGKGAQIESTLVATVKGLRYQQYAIDVAEFRGLITQLGAVGKLDARLGPDRVRFDGSMRWDKTQRLAGYVQASSRNSASIPSWLRVYLSAGTSYRDASFSGWVSYYPETQARASGELTASQATYSGETLRNARALVRYDGETVIARLQRGSIRGRSAQGVVAYNQRSQTISGAVDTLRLDLAELSQQFGIPGLSGTAVVTAAVGGTTAKPVVSFHASGSGRYRYRDISIPLNSFQASGTYGSAGLKLTRALIESEAGVALASGTVTPSGKLALDVVGRGVRPRLIDPRLGGSGNFVADVTGTLESPLVKGRVEGYALTYEGEFLPAATAEFTATKDYVAFRDVEAFRGSATITGSGRFTFRNEGIQADLKGSGIQIADFLGDEFVGAVQVPSLELSGTLARPIVTGLVRGENILARGVKIDQLNARLQTVGDEIQLQDTFANFAGGAVTAVGGFNVARRSGTITFSGSNIELNQLLPEFAAYVSASGKLSGAGSITLENGELVRASGEGQFADVVVNDTPVGSGPWSVSTSGDVVSGTLEIGQLDRFITIEDATYNTVSEQVSANLHLFNILLPDLVAISGRYLPTDLSWETLRTLRSIDGQVSMSALISGTPAQLNVDVPTLHAGGLEVRDTAFEALDASFARENGVWNIRSFVLLGDPNPTQGIGRRGQAKYSIDGTVDEDGDLAVNGDFTNVALAEFSALVPWFTGKSGEINFSFSATGPTRSPSLRATLLAQGLLAELDPELLAEIAQAEAAGGLTDEQRNRFYEKTLSVNLSEISVSEGSGDDRGIRIAGDYSYTGFKGMLSSFAPFRYPFEIPSSEPAGGEITLAERDLNEIAVLLNILDPERTAGTVSGRVVASGTPSNLVLSGGGLVKASSFAFDMMDDTVKDMTAELKLENERLSLEASGTSSRGGVVQAHVAAPVADLGNFASAVQQGFTDTLLNNPLEGTFTLREVGLQQTLFETGRVSGVFSGDVALSGTIASPLLKGTASLSKLETQMPTIVAGTAERETPIVNPRFEIDATLSDPAHIRSSGADLYLLGSGTLRGTLQFPTVAADLYVDRGNVRLPGGNVRIEQGGSVELRYDSSALDTYTSLMVDLEGRTAVTAPRFGDILERYDITISIRGDLLTEGGLAMTATSDPPDLSQDRILALLGQTELLSTIGSGLSGGGFASDTEQRLRSAVLGFALPLLLDPVTGGLAKSLGLDYLSVEYNAYEQATLVFAKPLGGGWSIQGRRQITPPPPGFPAQFDIRLVYRPRRLPGILNRFSFSFGADELRPWKAAVEYGSRFSTGRATKPATQTTIISGPGKG